MCHCFSIHKPLFWWGVRVRQNHWPYQGVTIFASQQVEFLEVMIPRAPPSGGGDGFPKNPGWWHVWLVGERWCGLDIWIVKKNSKTPYNHPTNGGFWKFVFFQSGSVFRWNCILEGCNYRNVSYYRNKKCSSDLNRGRFPWISIVMSWVGSIYFCFTKHSFNFKISWT